jgi:hypothetical protein
VSAQLEARARQIMRFPQGTIIWHVAARPGKVCLCVCILLALQPFSATSLSDRAASSSIDESSRFFTSRLTFAVTASCSQLGTSYELRREKNQRTPIRFNVASGQGSKTNLWHDGPNVREPKPRRDVDEGHNGCGARRNGPRPKSRSPEPRNSLGQEEAAPLPRSELEARFECTRARWMKFALL